MDLLPRPLWCANGLPGPISGISPHLSMFARDQIGFGEHPPTDPEVGCEDALQFFNRVRSEREIPRDKLSRPHELRTKEFLAQHPAQKFEPGDRVWLRVHPKPGDSKLGWLWVGPAKMLHH